MVGGTDETGVVEEEEAEVGEEEEEQSEGSGFSVCVQDAASCCGTANGMAVWVSLQATRTDFTLIALQSVVYKCKVDTCLLCIGYKDLS